MSVGQAIRRNWGWALAMALLAGLSADLLTPLAPFATYLFLAAAVASTLLIMAILVKRVMATRLLPAVVFSLTAMLVAGGLWQLQAQNDTQNGVLADVLPLVRDVQRRLGVLQVDVSTTREGVGRIESAVSRVEMRQGRTEAQARLGAETAARTEQEVARLTPQVRETAATTARIAATLEEVSRNFAALSRTDGLVANPTTPAEHYHNARVLEARGDGLGARRAYLQVASADLDAIDVYQRLATLLRVQDGRAGAREVFASLSERGRAPALALVAATQFEGSERAERLAAFAAAHPDYAPAQLLLADEWSEARLGSQTLSERRREREALQRFLDADQAGALTHHVLDPSVLGEWTENARRRIERIDRLMSQSQTEPRAVFMRSNIGWGMTVSLPEPATRLSYRLGEDGPFTPTGDGQAVDPRTGRPFPQLYVPLPTQRIGRVIQLSYVDMRGVEAGPFAIAFDPMEALVRQQRQQLDITRQAWIAFPHRDRALMFFTTLITARCAIRTAEFGLDGAEPTTTLPLPPCNPEAPFTVPSRPEPYLTVPAATRSVRVRLTFVDGAAAEESYERVSSR